MAEISKKPKGKLRWGIVILGFVILMADYIDRGIITTAMPMITQEFHLNAIDIALIGNGFLFGYLVMNPITGYFLDRRGMRKNMTIFPAMWGVIQLITSAAFNGLYLGIMRVLLGISEAIDLPGVTKITSTWVSKQEKARAATIGDSGVNLGIVFGSLLLFGLGLIISGNLLWRMALIVNGIITLLISNFIYIYLRDKPEEHSKITKEELEYIKNNQDVSAQQQKVKVSEWFKYRTYWGVMQGLGAQAGVYFVLLAFLSTYLYYVRGFNIGLTFTYTAFIWTFGFIGEITGGFVIDKIISMKGPNVGLKLGFAVSSLSVTLGLLTLMNVSNSITAIVVLIITFFFLRWSGIQWSVASFVVPAEYTGQFGGHIGFWETLWGILIPLTFGATITMTKAWILGMYMLVVVGLIYFIGMVLVPTYKPLKTTS